MKNKPFRRDFTIEPHQDYIGVLKKDYVSWELECDQVEQKIDNIEEEKREMQQNNEHLNAKILSLMNSQQKASGIDKLTNDSINHFKEILKENTQKINSLNEEIYQLTDELSKLEKPNMPPSFNEAKDTTELPASKNNSFFDSRVLFIPKHTSLVLNNEYKPYNAYLIGVSTNLNYFFHNSGSSFSKAHSLVAEMYPIGASNQTYRTLPEASTFFARATSSGILTPQGKSLVTARSFNPSLNQLLVCASTFDFHSGCSPIHFSSLS